MSYDKQYEMQYVEAEAGEDFTIPSDAEKASVEYIERQDGSMFVRVAYLLRTDGGGSIK